MNEKCYFLLGIVLHLMVVSKSRVIVPRALPKDRSSENGEIPLSINPLEKDNKFDFKSVIWDPPTVDNDFNTYDYDAGVNGPRGRPFDYDYNKPDRGVNEIDDNLPGTKPERFPVGADRDERPEGKPIEKNDIDKSGDENSNDPLDGKDSEKPGSDDKDVESSSDEDKPMHKGGDESDVKDTGTEESEDSSDKEFKPEEEEKPDEERKDEEEKHKPEDDDEKKDIPEEEPVDDGNRKEMPKEVDEESVDPDNKEEIPEEVDEESVDPDNKEEMPKEVDEESVDPDNKEEMPKEVDEESVDHEDDSNNEEGAHEGGEASSFSGGSIFDTPFFNLEQVKKYFSQLGRALGHVFHQTLDEARLLNGTYANTTEEEVDIDGKKYIITKSIIQGADNHSSLYVESLASKPKPNDTELSI